MPKPPITPETQALLDRILPPKGKTTTSHTDSVYELVAPLHKFIHDIEDELREVERLRRAADRTEEAPYAYAFFERIKQTIEAANRQAKEAIAAIDALTDTKFQLDSYALDMDRSLETHNTRTQIKS